MKIRLKKKETFYAQIHKNLLFSKLISIQAKGIGAILECYSDNYTLSFESLKIHSMLNDKTLRKYLKQLEENQFLFRIQIIKNFELIWFFDSQTLDVTFVLDEVEKITKNDRVRFVTTYQFLAGDNMVGQGVCTDKNTTTEKKFSDMDALNIMHNSLESKKKEKQKIRNLNSNYYKDKNGKLQKKQLTVTQTSRIYKRGEIEI